jgi:hypothetical protein
MVRLIVIDTVKSPGDLHYVDERFAMMAWSQR